MEYLTLKSEALHRAQQHWFFVFFFLILFVYFSFLAVNCFLLITLMKIKLDIVIEK